MSQVLRPSALLSRAIRCRTLGDLLGEEKALHQCLNHRLSGRVKQRAQEFEAQKYARFYLALSGCQRSKFEEADRFLSELGLGARLADNVWSETLTSEAPDDFFVRVVDEAIPDQLMAHARRALHPESIYWSEHNYEDQELSFFSHAHPLGQEIHVIDQIVEIAREALASVRPEVAEKLTIAEWWVHHRRPDQWHGHPLHFDTDEQLLRKSRGSCVRHPSVSTVVYLCDNSENFGPTLVTNQQPSRRQQDNAASLATVVRPKMGRILFFDGSYLHGAMPGRPWLAGEGDPRTRLNLMIGFWTEPIDVLPAEEGPGPLGGIDPKAAWVQALSPLPGKWTAQKGVVQTPAVTSPIWNDVPGVSEPGDPFFGRFFLTHRGQVDQDLFE